MIILPPFAISPPQLRHHHEYAMYALVEPRPAINWPADWDRPEQPEQEHPPHEDHSPLFVGIAANVTNPRSSIPAPGLLATRIRLWQRRGWQSALICQRRLAISTRANSSRHCAHTRQTSRPKRRNISPTRLPVRCSGFVAEVAADFR
jgi:hypothetical protein